MRAKYPSPHGILHFVAEVGLEPTCNRLPFQQRIRQRGYSAIKARQQSKRPYTTLLPTELHGRIHGWARTSDPGITSRRMSYLRHLLISMRCDIHHECIVVSLVLLRNKLSNFPTYPRPVIRPMVGISPYHLSSLRYLMTLFAK